jgi:hypothetical protein
MVTRADILKSAKTKFKTKPDYPWSAPKACMPLNTNTAILRSEIPPFLSVFYLCSLAAP